MSLTERIDRLLTDGDQFSTARESTDRLWVSESGSQRVRPAWRVAHDLQRRLESAGLQVNIAQQRVDGRSVPCIEVLDHADRPSEGELQRLLVVSPAMLAKFEAVNQQLQALNRKDPSYDNVRAFAALIQQGLFLSRRKVKEARRRVSRVQREVIKPLPTPAVAARLPAPVRVEEAAVTVVRPTIVLERNETRFGSFVAFDCAWEIHLEGASDARLRALTEAAAAEACRVESAISSRQTQSLAQRIQQAGGEWLELDHESEQLLDAAHRFWTLSQGRFDLTTAALGRHWANLARLAALALPGETPKPPEHGWHRIEFAPGRIRVPRPLSISLDGLAKSYALDRIRHLAGAEWDGPALVRAGGDLAVDRAAASQSRRGIQDVGPVPPGLGGQPVSDGALAVRRGRRTGTTADRHEDAPTVDGSTGRPLELPALSVSVVCGSSLDAYGYASAALSQGLEAEALLKSLPVSRFWVVR